MNQDDILKLCSNRCNYQHNICTQMQSRILALHKSGKKVDNSFLTIYLSYVFDKSGYNSGYYACQRNTGNWIPALKEICKYLMPTDENLKLITYGNQYIIPVFQILIDRGVSINSSILQRAIEGQYLELVKYFLDHIVADSKCLEFACARQNTDNLIKIMLDSKVEITITALNNAILNKKEEVANIMLQYGVQPDVQTLESACKSRSNDTIRRILDYRILPTRECYNGLFVNISYYSSATTKTTIASLIDLLIVYGYKLDYDDVLFALNKQCHINDIKRFNIDFKPEFMERCVELNYYPYVSILDLKPSMKCLHMACERTNNIANVKKLINAGLKPDTECLRRACNNKTNKPIVQYLVEHHKLVPDLKCLKNNAKYLNNPTLTYLLNHVPDYSVEVEKTDDEIKEENEQNAIVKEVKDNNISTVVKNEEQVSKKEEHLPKKDANIEENKEDEKEPQNTYILMSLKVPDSVPKSKRIKCKINNKVLKFFSLKNGTKLSFLEIRKLLVNYVKEENMYDEDDKTYIKPNKQICKLLSINGEYGKYINFNDFDRLVSQCYN